MISSLWSPLFHSLRPCSLHRFTAMCEDTGIPIATEKTFGPSTKLSFAGIDFDSIEMTARLPSDKVQKCLDAIKAMKVKKKVKLREMQSLIGLLNFACSVVVPGRAFLRRLIDLTKGVKRPFHRVSLNKEARADLAAWELFLDSLQWPIILP